jgi:hypothetical protein
MSIQENFLQGWKAPGSRVLAQMKFFGGIFSATRWLLLERGFAPRWGVR